MHDPPAQSFFFMLDEFNTLILNNSNILLMSKDGPWSVSCDFGFTLGGFLHRLRSFRVRNSEKFHEKSIQFLWYGSY